MNALDYRYDIDGHGHVRAVSGDTWIQTGRVALDGIRKTTCLGPFDVCERDLLRVAAAVLDADRLSPRLPDGRMRRARDLRWQRTLSVRIAVEDPSRWIRVEAPLARLLHFMTDDTWEVTFADAPRPMVQQLLPRTELDSADEVALFSGGLDSVAGLYARSRARGGHFVAVSACGTEVRGHAQGAALDELRELGINATSLRLVHQLRATQRSRSRMEASQRSRGLLFLAMGAVTAARLSKAEFCIYETGVGCINLPMSRAQVSAQGTRAMHPLTIALFNDLLESVLDQPVRAIVPFFLLTKGELCSVARSVLPRLARITMSCDEGEGHKSDAMEHCGACTSCLFRRIALFSAGQMDPTSYRDVIMRRHGRYEQLAFESHASELLGCATFTDLVEIDPYARFAAAPPLDSPLSAHDAKAQVLAMYRRYAEEIKMFFEHARPILARRSNSPRKGNDRGLFAAAG